MKKKLLAFLLLGTLMLCGCTGPAKRTVPSSSALSEEIAANKIDQTGKPVEPVEPTSEVTSGKTSEKPAKTEGKVSFLAAGDVLIHEAVFTDAMARATALAGVGGYSEKYEFRSMFEGVAPTVQAADLSFVNFECPIAGDDQGARGYPNFNAPTASGKAIAELGFDVVNIANNHMLDMDGITKGLDKTIDFWKTQPVLLVGGYTESDWDELRIAEKNGLKIAFLSYTYGTNYGSVNTGRGAIVPTFKESRMEAQVKAARAAADFVIVSMHWGEETSYATGVTKPNSTQKRLAQLLCDWGADAIIGTHPHVMQDVEWYQSGDHKMLCYYSLGNFISTQHPYSNLVGGFASFEIVRGADGVCRAENALLIPNATWYSKQRDSLAVMLLSDMTEEKVAAHGSQLRSDYNGKSRFDLSDLYSLVKKQVSAAYLPDYMQN